jgi:hypothetical protein
MLLIVKLAAPKLLMEGGAQEADLKSSTPPKGRKKYGWVTVVNDLSRHGDLRKLV